MFDRPTYVDAIMKFADAPLIKVLTGIRRCGKSTILLMLIEALKKRGISSERILKYRRCGAAGAHHVERSHEGHQGAVIGRQGGLQQRPKLAWYTDNVRISGERRHADKENWMPTKRNKFRKIDGFMAWLDAHCVRMDKQPAGMVVTPPRIRVVDLGGQRHARI